MGASVEAHAVVEGSSRYRWKWQKVNVSRGLETYGESSKEQVTKHAEDGQIQGLGSRASEEGILQWTGSLEAGL